MTRKHPDQLLIAIALIFLSLAQATFAQTLTVRQIMSEPSIAGMRAEGEKLSPDGTKVVFLWNADGQLPRDLYLVPTAGGSPHRILSPSDLPVPSRPPEKENKLDYGLIIRDEFVRSRENQLGNFEWSPDSRRLVFSHGGDLYVFNVAEPPAVDRWPAFEQALRRRADLIPNILEAVKAAGIQEAELAARLAEARARFLNALNVDASIPDRRREIAAADQALGAALRPWFGISEAYPQLKTNDVFIRIMKELQAVEERIAITRQEQSQSQKLLNPRRLTRTQTPETGARFIDNDRILFSQSGNFFVWDLSTSMITQISRESNPTAFVSVFNATPNKAGTLVAYVVSDSSKNKALVVPNYLDEFVVANTTRRGWTEQKVMVMPTDGTRDAPFEIKLPKPEGVSSIRRMVWAGDNSSLLIDRIDKDTKRRTLFYVHDAGSKGEKIIPVIEETDDKWQASLSAIFEPNPNKPGELFFVSEKDGYAHLYQANLERASAQPNPTNEVRQENPGDAGFTGRVDVTQITKGNFEVNWAKWSSQGEIVFASTEGSRITHDPDPGYTERQLYLYRPAQKDVVILDVGNGMRTGFQISETAKVPVVLFEGSAWNHPGELYVQNVSQSGIGTTGTTKKLTTTVPAAFFKLKWTEPKFIEIPSRDGKKIPAKIYLPPNFNPKAKQKYPMAIFVHGAGYLQNVINGWNNYYREFMFNDLLAKRGYVVLDIDYRGSAGYGRDWRTDVYDFLGGKDYDDHIDSIDYMVANYNVNPAKVGAYGGSYGGFMAGMLVMRAPDKIAAAAALRPVFDWKNYYAANPGYTAQRLGFPDKNPEAYRRSSPISYAEKLERPLLILHGMADDNVHVQDSIQLMEKLIRLGKTQYFEAMLYPSENHGFVRPESWADEYERILAFFEKHLK